MDASPKPPQSTAIKILKLLLKLVISALCLWYVSGKINWKEAKEALQMANGGWMALAALAFVLSKIFSSVRLLLYFRDIDVPLSQVHNLRLYWLGMFYNLFLPGAISGDAYKVILLKKWFETPYKKAGAAVLLDRLSGVIALGVLLAVYSWFVFDPLWIPGLLSLGALVGIVILWFIISRWMRDFEKSYLSTLLWGLAVQAMQVLCVYCIMAGFSLDIGASAYIFLFLVSSVAAVLPLTVGGLGIRELVFLEGSLYFGLMESNAVLISLVFYLITLLCSLPGVIYVFKPVLKTAPAAEK